MTYLELKGKVLRQLRAFERITEEDMSPLIETLVLAGDGEGIATHLTDLAVKNCDYENLKKKDLVNLLRQRGLRDTHKYTKAQLIGALENGMSKRRREDEELRGMY